MTKKLVALVAVAVLSLSACSDEPDVEACEEAMQELWDQAVAQDIEGERPAECEGVSDEELERIAGEILADQFDA